MKTLLSAVAGPILFLAVNPARGTPLNNAGDLLVDVDDSTILKLSAADGTALWSVGIENDGALAVDPIDFGVYTGIGNRTSSGTGTIYKFTANGTLSWTNSINIGSGCNFTSLCYAAVDATSSNPGVVWIQKGCVDGIAKSDRSTGAQWWSVLTDDIGPTLD